MVKISDRKKRIKANGNSPDKKTRRGIIKKYRNIKNKERKKGRKEEKEYIKTGKTPKTKNPFRHKEIIWDSYKMGRPDRFVGKA